MPNEKIILIIIEGEKTEGQIFTNIEKVLFTGEKNGRANIILVQLPAKQNIYQLWKQLKKDEFQTDVVEVLRESSEAAARILTQYKRDDIAEAYLFFDFDIQHVQSEKNTEFINAIPDMLEAFSEETESGKLYINYPMVEALRDLDEGGDCGFHCVVQTSEMQKYKESVGSITKYHDSRKYDYLSWGKFCGLAVRRADCLKSNKRPGDCSRGGRGGSRPNVDHANFSQMFPQDLLYKCENNNFLVNGEVLVLCSIPLFLLDYLREPERKRLLGYMEA